MPEVKKLSPGIAVPVHVIIEKEQLQRKVEGT